MPYTAEEDNLHRIRKLERQYHFDEDDFTAEHAKQALAATEEIEAFDSRHIEAGSTYGIWSSYAEVIDTNIALMADDRRHYSFAAAAALLKQGPTDVLEAHVVYNLMKQVQYADRTKLFVGDTNLIKSHLEVTKALHDAH